jgi:hypothetical protein
MIVTSGRACYCTGLHRWLRTFHPGHPGHHHRSLAALLHVFLHELYHARTDDRIGHHEDTVVIRPGGPIDVVLRGTTRIAVGICFIVRTSNTLLGVSRPFLPTTTTYACVKRGGSRLEPDAKPCNEWKLPSVRTVSQREDMRLSKLLQPFNADVRCEFAADFVA